MHVWFRDMYVCVWGGVAAVEKKRKMSVQGKNEKVIEVHNIYPGQFL